MADDAAPTEPTPADLTPIDDGLTLTQLRARRDPARAEHRRLATTADRTLAVSRRLRELKEFLVVVEAAIDEIEATSFDVEPDPEPDPTPTPSPAPAPEAVTPEPAAAPTPAPEPIRAPAAPASETPPTPEPAAETPPEPAPEPEPAAATTAVISDLTDEQIGQAMDHLTAELTSRGEAPGEGTGVVETLTPEVMPEGVEGGRAPIFATTGAGQFENVAVEGPATLADVGQRMLGLRKMAHLVPGNAPVRFNLYRSDKLAGQDVPRLGENAEDNTHLLFHANKATLGADSLAAAADLNICGDPFEVNVRGCDLDDTTPFLDALAGNSVAANNCVVRWRRPLSVEQVNPGPQLWTSCQQELVDPADRSTWKPLTMDLPPCEEYCTAQPFDTILGLGVTLNDITCRPERIDEMNRWISVFHAILLEQTAMSIFDLQVGPQHHFSFDAASTAANGRPAIGALQALGFAVHALTSRSGIDRHSPTQGWTAAMHPSILNTLAADMWLAGEGRGDPLAALRELFASAGVTNIVLTKDFGICEGVLATGYQQNAFLCHLENCDIPTYNDPGTGCVAFGGGVSLPELVTDTRIRFFQDSNWWHGSTFLVDYALHSSAELMRQNRAEYFGERRDLLFKTNDCHSLEFVLDVSNLCATGQRIEHIASFPCPSPTGGGNGAPPLAPGISGIGQPNPRGLPDTPDVDPGTEPPRVGVGGPNPDPGTAPGTAIPGGTPGP